jgi:hypothetical protein
MTELSRYHNNLKYSLQDIRNGEFRAGPKFIIIRVFEREKMSQVIEVVRNLDPMAEKRYGEVLSVGRDIPDIEAGDKALFLFRPTQKQWATWITSDGYTITAIPEEMLIMGYNEDDSSDIND